MQTFLIYNFWSIVTELITIVEIYIPGCESVRWIRCFNSGNHNWEISQTRCKCVWIVSNLWYDRINHSCVNFHNRIVKASGSIQSFKITVVWDCIPQLSFIHVKHLHGRVSFFFFGLWCSRVLLIRSFNQSPLRIVSLIYKFFLINSLIYKYKIGKLHSAKLSLFTYTIQLFDIKVIVYFIK